MKNLQYFLYGLAVLCIFALGASLFELICGDATNWTELSIASGVLGIYIACMFGE